MQDLKTKKVFKKSVKVSAVRLSSSKSPDIQTDRNCMQLRKYQECIMKVPSICQPNVSEQSVLRHCQERNMSFCK